MVDNPTPQSAPAAAPQDAAQTLRAQRNQLSIQYPPPIVDTMRPEEIMNLSPDALVVILGAPGCDIRDSNTVKKIPNNATGMGFVVGRMPQLVDANAGGWNRQLDYDCDGQVEYHEILASMIRGAQLAYQRGIPLDRVPVGDLQAADIAPITARLTGHAPEVCVPTQRTNVQETGRNTGRE